MPILNVYKRIGNVYALTCLLNYVCASKLTHSEMINMISLTLHPFDQSQSITKCTTGLLAKNDRLIIAAHIRLSEPSSNEHVTASFQWKNEERNEYVDLMMKRLGTCSVYLPTEDIYCSTSESGRDYTIYMNMTAVELLSEKTISMKVFIGEMFKSSTEIILPIIQNVSKVHLSLNGTQLDMTNRTFEFTPEKGDKNLRLCCESSLAPCYAVITPAEGPPIIENTCASYKINWVSTLKLGFIICATEDYKEHITLHLNVVLTNDFDHTTEETHISGKDIIKFVLLGLLLIVFCTSITMYCYKTGRSARCLTNLIEKVKKRLSTKEDNVPSSYSLTSSDENLRNPNEALSETHFQSSPLIYVPIVTTLEEEGSEEKLPETASDKAIIDYPHTSVSTFA